MNLSYFIAKRVAITSKQSFSRLIIRIAIAAIALCLAVMIIATAMISGFKKEIKEKIFGFWGHISITDINTNLASETEPISKNQTFYPSLKDIESIEYMGNPKMLGIEMEGTPVEQTSKGGIRHIQVYALKPGIIQTKGVIEGIILKGVDKDFDWSFMQKFLQEGEVFDFQDTLSTNRPIIISQQTADRLNVQLNDSFIIIFIEDGNQVKRRFQVTGIYKTGLAEYDQRIAIIDIRVIQQLLGWESDQVGGFEVFLEDIDDLPVFREYIYYEVLPNRLVGESIQQKNPAIFDWLEFQNINERIIIILMIIVAIINMITALMILIIERTNMIGILKAMGSTDWDIRKIFLYQATLIIGSGLLWGNLLGIGLCLAEDYFHFITLQEENYYLSYAPIDLKFWTILLLNIGTVLITLIFLVIPTYLVTKISPIKAIRFN